MLRIQTFLHLVVFFISIHSFYAFAQEQTRPYENRQIFIDVDGTRKFVVAYEEGGYFMVDVFQQRPGRFQDRLTSERFSAREGAEARLRDVAKNWRSEGGRAAAQEEFPLDDHGGRSGSMPNEYPPSEVASGALWQVRHQWNWDWEQAYARWIESEVNEDFFVRYRISTDCADAAYALRWIFARINGLPAGNRLSATGALFTQNSLRGAWMNLRTSANWWEDQRFLAAINYLMDNTYTHMLMRDSYPVAINREALMPGAYHLGKMGQTGHTQIVWKLRFDAQALHPLYVLYSDVPRQVRPLYVDYLYTDLPARNNEAGMMRFRWPVIAGGEWRLAANEAMPHYSLEQFTPAFVAGHADWLEAIQKRLLGNQPGPGPDVSLVAMANRLQMRWLDRVEVVSEGFRVCGGGRCSNGSANYEAWSTPSRDGVIRALVDALAKILNDNPQDPAVRAAWARVSATDMVEVGGRTLNFGQLVDIWLRNAYSSDPNARPERRWGL